MDIRLNVEVRCHDQPLGSCSGVILDPVTDKVTHLVVKDNSAIQAQRLVPVSRVQEGTPEYIQLSCTRQEFERMEQFVDTEFIPTGMSDPDIAAGMMWAYSVPDTPFIVLEHEHVPPSELAIHKGSKVRASDGRIGRVDEFLIDAQSGKITHLVMKEGHLWGQKDVTIPVEQIDHIEEDTVFLKLDRKGVERLPAVKYVKRKT